MSGVCLTVDKLSDKLSAETADRSYMRFAASRFLTDRFQTATGVVRLFDSYRAGRLAEASVQKWFTRNSIPSRLLPVMLALLELETGKPVSLTKYLDGGAA